MKKSENVKNDIVAYVRTQYKTREDVCQKFGIGRSTLCRWEREDEAFKLRMDAAVKERLMAELSPKAVAGLKKLVSGFKATTERSVYLRMADGSERLVSRTVTKQDVAPDARAIMFVLANMEPENFEK